MVIMIAIINMVLTSLLTALYAFNKENSENKKEIELTLYKILIWSTIFLIIKMKFMIIFIIFTIRLLFIILLGLFVNDDKFKLIQEKMENFYSKLLVFYINNIKIILITLFIIWFLFDV